MKIKKLTEEKAMKFNIKESEKDYLSTRHFNEDYDDNVDALQNSLGFETTSEKPTLFVFDVDGETVLELTLEQITAILKANGYGEPIWKVGSERGYLI